MDELERTMPITLRIVTGVSIGAINGACIVGAKGKSEAERRKTATGPAQIAVERPQARNAVSWTLPDAIRLAEHFACARHVAAGITRLLRAAPRCLEFSALDQHLRHERAERDAGQARLLQRDRRQQDGICRFGSRRRLRDAEALPQCGGSREAPAAARRGRRGRAVHRRAHHGERKPRAAVSVDQDRHAALLGRRHCRQHAAGRRDGGLFGRRCGSIGCWS